MNVMPVNILIKKVAEICKKNGVKKLVLIGSFATDTATPYSDIDFVGNKYAAKELMKLWQFSAWRETQDIRL